MVGTISKHACARRRYCSRADSLLGRSRIPAIRTRTRYYEPRQDQIHCKTEPSPAAALGYLFRDHSSRRGARSLFRRRDHEGDPGIPAIGAILRGELLVALQIDVALQVTDRKDEAELRADADHLRLEAADPIAGTAVATDLLVHVAHESDLKLLGQELRRAPIEMHVDAVLVLGRLIGEIVGEAEHAGEFMPGLRIEIGVAAAAIDCPMSDADIREARRIVGSDRDVPGDVGHIVVNARTPAQRRYR